MIDKKYCSGVGLLLFAIACLCLFSCGKKVSPGGIEVLLDKSLQGDEDSLWIYTYSPMTVYPHKYAYGEAIQLPNTVGPDTVLLHLVFWNEGHRILPLLPNDEGEKIVLKEKKGTLMITAQKGSENAMMANFGKTLFAEKESGFPLNPKQAELLFQLCETNPSSAAAEVYLSLHRYYRTETSSDSLLMHRADSLMRSVDNKFAYLNSVLMGDQPDPRLLGEKPKTLQWDDDFFYREKDEDWKEDDEKKKSRLNLSKLWDKKRPEALIAAYLELPSDSANLAAEKRWMSKADSLGIPVVSMYLLRDTLPDDLVKKRRYPKRFIAQPDTMGVVTLAVEQLSLRRFPVYLHIDSLYHVSSVYHHPDSLMKIFLKKEKTE